MHKELLTSDSSEPELLDDSTCVEDVTRSVCPLEEELTALL